MVGKYPSLFREAQLSVPADAKPIFVKARPVPYALREKTEQELERLQGLGVIDTCNLSGSCSQVR